MIGSKHDPKDLRMAIWLHGLGLSYRRIEKNLQGRIDHTTIARLCRQRMQQSVAQRSVASEQEDEESNRSSRNLAQEIDHYQPAMASSFNSGLGTPISSQTLDKLVKGVSEAKDYLGVLKNRYQLKAFLDEKSLDPIANRFREFLKKRVQGIGFFDGASDNDKQFGLLNDLARLGLFVIREHERACSKKKLNLSKLVDAVICYRLPEMRKKLQESERRLRCPRCNDERPFLRSILKGQEMIACLKCGLELRKDEASFRVTPKSVDVEYLSIIDQIVTEKLKVEANS